MLVKRVMARLLCTTAGFVFNPAREGKNGVTTRFFYSSEKFPLFENFHQKISLPNDREKIFSRLFFLNCSLYVKLAQLFFVDFARTWLIGSITLCVFGKAITSRIDLRFANSVMWRRPALFFLDCGFYVKLAQLFFVDFARRMAHRVYRALRLREGDNVTD